MKEYSRLLILMGIGALIALGLLINKEWVPHTKIVYTTKNISFKTNSYFDYCAVKGSNSVVTKGHMGIETTKYKVTTVDGRVTSKKEISQDTTKYPTSESIAVGVASTPEEAKQNAPFCATSAGGYTNVDDAVIKNAINTILNPPAP